MIRTIPVARDGHVIQDDSLIEEMRSPGLTAGRFSNASIQLCQHTDGLWMWSSSTYFMGGGRTYRVGPKWGRFADTRDEALHAACDEIKEVVEGPSSPAPANTVGPIIRWLDSLIGQKQMDLFS
jgi:hypothetical protein